MATKKTSKKGSGFDVPTIGTICPDGSIVKRLPNGRIKIIEPKKKKSKKS